MEKNFLLNDSIDTTKTMTGDPSKQTNGNNLVPGIFFHWSPAATMIFSLRSNMISRRLSLGQRHPSGHIIRRSSSTSSSLQQCDTVWRAQSVDNNEINVSDWIDRSVFTKPSGGMTSDSENEGLVLCARSSEDDLKLGAEAIVSDLESSGGSNTNTNQANLRRLDTLARTGTRGNTNLASQDSESSWTSNMTGSSHHSKGSQMPGLSSMDSLYGTRCQLNELMKHHTVAPEWTENGTSLKALSSFSQLSSIANVDGVNCALDSLPMTATDILYNLGFAASDTTVQVPQRFLGVTHANLGDWNGQVNWSDQTAPISNFEYLFNMMDDTPAMEEEVVDDMSMTDTSYKSAHSFNTSRGESSNSSFENIPTRSTPIKTSGSTSSSGHSNKQTAVVQRTPSTSSWTSSGKRPKMIRSHSLPEICSKTLGQNSKDNQSSTNSDKSFPKTMKLKRHRSQLCLQQSFDTITEEEEDNIAAGPPLKTFEKLETIKGSFSQSMDSVMGAAPVKPSMQRNTSNYDMLVEKMESSVDNAEVEPSDHSLTETTENTATSMSSEKKAAKLKRQSCEEIYQEPYSETPATWDELKTKLEAVERKSWNTTFSRIKERRSMFSKQKGSLSLPVSVSHSERVILPIRRCITIGADQETETDTSESHSEVSVNTKKSEESRGLTGSTSLPFFSQCSRESGENDGASTTTIDSDSAWFAPAITVEHFVTEENNDNNDNLPLFTQQDGQLSLPSSNGRPTSPALSNASEATLIPEDDEIEQEKNLEKTAVPTADPEKPSSPAPQKQVLKTGRLKKMKSSIIFSSLHDSYNSPFYIYTPKLGFRKRSSSMPLLCKPTLVKSKLRRAVTDSPHSLNNIIEEYDADVDDDELMCEQEEWESRIYINILKSISSCSNENLLKQIEDRVEGTSDEALKVKKNGRRKKASFSKSGDEEIPTSSGGEAKSDLLAVKPRRKRRRSRDRKLDMDMSYLSPAISQYEQTSDHLVSDSHRSSMNTTPEPPQNNTGDIKEPCDDHAGDIKEPRYDHAGDIKQPRDDQAGEEKEPIDNNTGGTIGPTSHDQSNAQKDVTDLKSTQDQNLPEKIHSSNPDGSPEDAGNLDSGGRRVPKSLALSSGRSLDSEIMKEERSNRNLMVKRRPSHGVSRMKTTEERLSDIIKKDEIKIREDNTGREDDNKIPDIKLSKKPTKSEVVSNCKNVVKEEIGDGSSGCKLDPDNVDPEWELKVLRDVIEHFEQDYAKTEAILEEKRVRDKRIRMEIKMLKTQIAVHKMEKKLCGTAQFKPVAVSTPRTKPLSDTSPLKNNKSLSPGTNRHRNSLNNFLINESMFVEK